MNEDEFQRGVIEYARLNGWLVMHIGDSRREVKRGNVSRLVGDTLTKGWPDLVLVHPKWGRLVIRELKSDKGRVRPDQKVWLKALASAGVDVGIWRPRDLPEVEATLGNRRRITKEAA